MTVAQALIGILGLAVLMVVHESGHYFAARHFGMRVTKFSIGFGPTLYKHKPKGSPTTFQIAVIPFLAYVQIAGLNPYEEIDPKDPGSYSNASLWARIVTISAGSLSNYFFASVFMFFGFWVGGDVVVDTTSMRVSIASPDGPAARAGIQTGDRIVAVNGEGIHDWDQLKKLVGSHPGEKIDVEIERGSTRMHVEPVPGSADSGSKGLIQIGQYEAMQPVTARHAAVLAVVSPAKVVYNLVRMLGRTITGREKIQLGGPVEMVRQTAAAAKSGAPAYLSYLGALSAYLGWFNLLPLPALDGGRLIFLGYEALSRRRADSRVEANVHVVGLLLFLTLMVCVTYSDLFTKH